MDELLDKTLTYKTMTPEDECWWKFEFRAEGGPGPTKWSWQAYRKRPGATFYTYQGPMSEVEVFSRLLRTGSNRLTDEDRLDLLFWLYLGGLQSFLESRNIKEE